MADESPPTPPGKSGLCPRLEQIASAVERQVCGQQFIIENRPAGANISAETVVKASPDAYTLLMVSVANTVNATHYDKLDFNSAKINRASGGNGAPSHVVGELFKMMIGVNIVHVPYRGSAPTLFEIRYWDLA